MCELGAADRSPDEVALGDIAADARQEAPLLLGLDAFGDDRGTE
jgi:hypothetical protein